MQSNHNNTYKSEDIVNGSANLISSETNGNLSYLYPNGHRRTHQMRWLKAIYDRSLKPDIAL